MSDQQRRAAAMVDGWNEPPLASFGQMQQDIIAALGQAAADARADLATKIEALIAEWGRDAANVEFHPITRELSNQHVYRLRAVLAAAAPTQDGRP